VKPVLKKAKPNLKDYLKTGKRVMAGSEQDPAPAVRKDAFLDLLAPPDLKMWQDMLDAGIAIQLLALDAASIRQEFQVMDRDRFTCYTLEKKGEPLRPVRLGSQIRDPLALLLKWDETGILTVYTPGV
jgi:hypothetical protein